MTPEASATLLAAAIGAVSASILFLIGELIRLVNARRAGRVEAATPPLKALDAIAIQASRPRFFRLFDKPEVAVMLTFMRMYGFVGKRDRVVVSWLLESSFDLIHGTALIRTGVAGELQGMLVTWMTNPRNARRRATREFKKWGVNVPRNGVIQPAWL